jgi:Tfp pilus assembly protein PilZ
MPDGIQHHVSGGCLSEIAEEFKLLDGRRRQEGLSLGEAERYHSLFARLSDALASQQRHRRVDARQFLRVKFPMTLKLRTTAGEILADCLDFGGGGLAIACPQRFQLGDDVWLDGATIEGRPYMLRGRAVVAWARAAAEDSPPGYGLRFCIDSRDMRDQVDRLLYRVLDRFLSGPTAH